MLMLHEREPGAASSRASCAPVTSRSTSSSCASTSTRSPSAGSRAGLPRVRPGIVHTHLVHGDVYGLPAGVLTRVRPASRRSTASTSSAPAACSPLPTARSGLAQTQIAISQRARRVPRGAGGVPAEQDFEVVHYGIEAGAEPPPPPGDRACCAVGRLIPIKGLTSCCARSRLRARSSPT